MYVIHSFIQSSVQSLFHAHHFASSKQMKSWHHTQFVLGHDGCEWKIETEKLWRKIILNECLCMYVCVSLKHLSIYHQKKFLPLFAPSSPIYFILSRFCCYCLCQSGNCVKLFFSFSIQPTSSSWSSWKF